MRYCASFFLLCAISIGQSLTPREWFYTPVNKPLTKPAAVQSAGKPAPAQKKTPESSRAKPPVVKQPAQSELVAAVDNPLVLRTSLLHSSNGSPYTEVDSETIFRSGDKLRVTAQSRDQAYLYVISRGSDGSTWEVLFPSSEMGGGDNKIAAMQSYEIPPGGQWAFDETPGEEKLFIVLSRKPVNDMESLIYDLGKSKKEPPPEKKTLLAQRIAPIDDALVGRLRAGVQARNLKFERVDEKTPGERKEKAVYVQTTTDSVNAQVVVDLTLKHR